ncbi:sensor histidine kinase [Streptomyces aureoverticillatus]|uniref:sensor histidine kinase n=1 Tax=Streptomyces aureoverticillatus TaxID=66871 RepID=UPI0013D9955F|nr:histidine kinase [Streptomyces aureoverticillatus]QIB47752.1 sensor histidine kinase [Streptomyces aureoverticillatus]
MSLSPRAVLVGVVAAVLAIADLALESSSGDSAPVTVLSAALTLAGFVALRWRRRRPVWVAVFVLACSMAYFPVSERDVPVLLIAFAFALFTVAAEGYLLAAVTLAVSTMLMIAIPEQISSSDGRHVDDTSIFLLLGWFVGLVAAGHAYSTRLAYLREVEQRALAAERERDVRARQSAIEERLRIARELHDVLGHNISLINVQSSAAMHRHAKGRTGAAEMAPAMEAIRDTSREALRELRATLGVLRQVDEAVPTVPADAGLTEIAGLADRASTAGLSVRTVMEVPEEVPRLPPQVGLAAYRIVQESLTNIVRHAEATEAVVTVRLEHDGADAGDGGDTSVRVRIEDNGKGMPGALDGAGRHSATGLGGSGLGGMAERARALGGELMAENIPGRTGGISGFRVEARIPVEDRR